MKIEIGISKIKKIARQMMRGKWFSAFAAVICVEALLRAPGFIIGQFIKSDFMSYILDLYTILVCGPLLLGLSCYFLEAFRGEDEGLGSFTKGFARAWNGISLFAMCFAFTFLWSLLFVIPGIIAAIRYSQAFFILADEPDLHPLACIAKSKQMMQPNLSKFFVLELSYVLWQFVLTLPSSVVAAGQMNVSGIISYQALMTEYVRVMQDPVVIVLSLLPILSLPFLLASNACFYDLASGNLVLEYGGEFPRGSAEGSIDTYEISFEESPEEGHEDE